MAGIWQRLNVGACWRRMGIILASRMGVLRKVEAKRVLPGTTSGPNSVEVQKMGRQLASARERVKLVREGKWPASAGWNESLAPVPVRSMELTGLAERLKRARTGSGLIGK